MIDHIINEFHVLSIVLKVQLIFVIIFMLIIKSTQQSIHNVLPFGLLINREKSLVHRVIPFYSLLI